MKKPILYKLRNQKHRVLDTLSEKQLLRRISSGKYTGEEEISAPPYVKWQKFSSHPTFFDAFMKRLYSKDYRSPGDDEGVSNAPQSKPSDMATRRGVPKTGVEGADDLFGTRRGEDDDNKTRRIPEENPFGGTVLQEDIDELFADVEDSSPEPPVEERGIDVTEQHTDLVALESVDQPLEPGGLEVPLQGFEAPMEMSATPPQPHKAQKPEGSRKRLLIYGAVGVLLVSLWMMGGDSEEDMPLVTKPPNPALVDIGEIEAGPNKNVRIKALLEEGKSLKANDTPLFYRGALEVFQEARRLEDADATIIADIAEAKARLLSVSETPKEDIAEIQALINQGRRLDPHYSGLYRAESLLAMAQGKSDKSVNAAASALESDPGNTNNLALAGEVQYARGEVAEAGQSLVEALRVDPTNLIARYLYGKVALDLGDLEAAQKEGLEALRLNPLHPPTYLLLADIAADQNKLEEAIGLYETCGRLARFTTPSVVSRAYFRLGQLREISGDRGAAQNAYRLAYHYDPALEGVKEKVSGLDTSSKKLEELARQEEYDTGYFRDQGDELVRQKKLNEALRFYQAAYLLRPDQSQNLIKMGEITEKVASSYEDFKRVMNYYQRAVARSPSDPTGYLKLGLLETEQYNLDRGLVLLRQAEGLAPEDPKVFVALGKHFYKRRDYNESLNYFLKAAKMNPSDSEILYYAGMLRLLFKKDSHKDAIRFFYQSYTVDPENYDALVEWLKLKVLGYEKNFAIKFVRNLIESDPQNANFYWALGQIYSTNREYRRSIGNYHKALDLDNRSSKFRMSLAEALEAIGDLPKATAEYRLASLLDRRNSDGFYRASDLLYRMKDYKSAEKVLNYLVSVTPNYPGAHRYLSKIYEQQKKRDLAIAAMEKEVKNNPENYKFVIELAQLYMTYEMYQKAVDQLQKVTNLPSLAKAPEFVYDKIRAFLLLSRSYRQLNRSESAEAAIRLALEIDPGDPELHRELGYVYYALQRDKEGVREFEFYLKRKPAAQDASKIKSLINKMRIDK